MSGFQDQWPRPRIGQTVKLRNKTQGTVISIRTANMVLKTLSEDRAYVLSAHQRARFGQNWRDVYYEADVMLPSGAVETVDTFQVLEAVDAS